jgi:probable O-glycosylation ligase (exosortase A-associated)
VLRTILVFLVLAFGLRHAVRGPFYALLLYLWVGYFRPEQWVWSGPVQALNLSLFIGIFALFLAVFTAQLKFNSRLLIIGLLLAQAFLSTLASQYFDFSWPFFVDFAKCCMIVWLIASLTTDVARLRLVVLVISISLGFEASKQGWAQFITNPGAKNANEIAFLGDNNGVAVGMFVLVGLLVALARTSTKRWEKWMHRLLSVGVVYRAITTYSRGGFISGAALGCMYLVRSKRRVAALTGLVIVTAILLPVLPTEFWDRMGTITTTSASIDSTELEEADIASSVSRIHFWNVAVIMASAHPFVGVGPAAFGVAYDTYDSLGGFYGHNRSVHSMWLGMLAELGYPGLILLVLSFGLGLLACRKARRLKGDSAEVVQLREFGIALESGLVVVAVGGAFVIYQYSEIFWHMIGLTIALHRLTEEYERRAPALEPAISVQVLNPQPRVALR